MTRTEIEQSLLDLNQLILEGKALEGFSKYYHDDVSMQENDLPPTITKSANFHREEEFFNNITEFRNAVVKGIGIGDDISFVVWKFDYTHRNWGIRNYEQVSVQQWKDGKIINEKFIYAN